MKNLYILLCLIAVIGLSGCIALTTGGHHPRSHTMTTPPGHGSPSHALAELRGQLLLDIPQSPV